MKGLCCSLLWHIREFKKWWRQHQRQPHKSMLWLVGQGKIIVVYAFWWKFSTKSANRQHEIFIFEVLTTTWAWSSKFFIICLCIKTSRAKQAKTVLCLFCTTWNNPKTLILMQSSILKRCFCCRSCCSFFNYLFSFNL